MNVRTTEVKMAQMKILCHQYEYFRMKQEETIQDMEKWFTHHGLEKM